MKMKRNILFIFLIVSLTACMLSSCGSGGSGGSAQSGGGSTGTGATGTGSVAILLTDNYTDEFSKIIVTITKIELLSDVGKYTIFSGSRKFDFLNLRNETTLMVVEDSVPAMWYEKIRLTVDDVTLFDMSGNEIPEEVDLTGNHKIDLNPRKHFYVTPGKMITIQLDLDAKNSLIRQNNTRYKFDPVVFIDIIGNIPPQTLVRIPGIIHAIDFLKSEFTLCFLNSDPEATSGMDDDYGDCTAVSVSDHTSLFDAITDGMPISFRDLKVRDRVTVIGFFSRVECDSDDEHHFGDDNGDDHDNDSCRVLEAEVVERGTFERVKGIIDEILDDKTFTLALDPGQVCATCDQIRVLLQESTKIFSVNHGEMVPASSLEAGDPVEIDGISLDTDSDPEPDIINAVFILVDLVKKLSGTIVPESIDYPTMTFDLILGTITQCVFVPDSAQIYLIDNTRDSSRLIDITGLSGNMQADVYGYEYDRAGCLRANNIIAFE